MSKSERAHGEGLCGTLSILLFWGGLSAALWVLPAPGLDEAEAIDFVEAADDYSPAGLEARLQPQKPAELAPPVKPRPAPEPPAEPEALALKAPQAPSAPEDSRAPTPPPSPAPPLETMPMPETSSPPSPARDAPAAAPPPPVLARAPELAAAPVLPATPNEKPSSPAALAAVPAGGRSARPARESTPHAAAAAREPTPELLAAPAMPEARRSGPRTPPGASPHGETGGLPGSAGTGPLLQGATFCSGDFCSIFAEDALRYRRLVKAPPRVVLELPKGFRGGVIVIDVQVYPDGDIVARVIPGEVATAVGGAVRQVITAALQQARFETRGNGRQQFDRLRITLPSEEEYHEKQAT